MKETNIMQKAILAQIKAHNANDEYLSQFNKGIKIYSIDKYDGRLAGQALYGNSYHNEYPLSDQNNWDVCRRIDDTFLRLTVKCEFKPAHKYDYDIVEYEVIFYSYGALTVMFDGLTYKSTEDKKNKEKYNEV